ncbi:MAG: helix-turn-helix domain-containing protein [Syntrophomonadaceae bacterium]|jgi:excisionase family DNA binding protein|nr:helix-turn-helix domain-containing protein [Clostridia bacterium]MDD4562014.1 helix-turn-helix domain-containing protein [Syntrophomonadaceae bacterium]
MDYYTPEQVAEKLQLSIHTIWKYLRAGKLPASKIARGYRVSEEQLDRFMKSLETKPGKSNE